MNIILGRWTKQSLPFATTFYQYHIIFLEYRKKDKENTSEDVIDYKGIIFLLHRRCDHGLKYEMFQNSQKC